MKQPDLLITHDTKILQQILQGVLGKSGNGTGISISLPSINQINIYFGANGELAAQIKGISEETTKKWPKSKEPLSRETILEVLESVGWRRNLAAQKLNRTPGGLIQRLQREGILPPSGEWPKVRRGGSRQIAERSVE